MDPPFNSKVSYNVLFGARRAKEQAEAFSDLWSWGPEDKGTLEQIGKKAESGNEEYQRLARTLNAIETFLGECGSLSYLIYMGERLTLLRQVLKRTGSIYLHCDPTMSHYLKILMDAIFGPKNFRNEIVWKRNTSHNSGSQFGRIHDTILFYSHEKKWTWNNTYAAKYSPEQLSRFKPDESGRLCKGENLTAARPDSDSGKFTWRGTIPGPSRGWAYTEEELEQMWAAGRILTKKDGSPRLYSFQSLTRHTDNLIEGEMGVIRASFLEGPEGFFNRHQVGGIRGQEEEVCAGVGDDLFRLLGFMEAGIIDYHDGVSMQVRPQGLPEPGVEDEGVTRAGKQPGREQALVLERGQQAGARPAVPGAQPLHRLAPGRPAVVPLRGGGKATLIDVQEGLAGLRIPIPALEIPSARLLMAETFRVPKSFFYG